MAKVTTFISTQGEVFTGTRASLMRTYGIKSKAGFRRPAGAVDEGGDRWLEQDKYEAQGGIKKKPLYLGARKCWGKDYKGNVTTWMEGSSETAQNYIWAKRVVNGEISDVTDEALEDFPKMIASVEAEFDVIDNATDNSPFTVELAELRSKQRYYTKSDIGYDARHKRILELESAYSKWSDAKLVKAMNDSIINKQQLKSTDAGMLKIAAMNGKLAEYRAGTWHPNDA